MATFAQTKDSRFVTHGLLVSIVFNLLLAIAIVSKLNDGSDAASKDNIGSPARQPLVPITEEEQSPLIEVQHAPSESTISERVPPGWVVIDINKFNSPFGGPSEFCEMTSAGLNLSEHLVDVLKITSPEKAQLNNMAVSKVNQINDAETKAFNTIVNGDESYYVIEPYAAQLNSISQALLEEMSDLLGSERAEIMWAFMRHNRLLKDGLDRREIGFSLTDEGSLHFDDGGSSYQIEHVESRFESDAKRYEHLFDAHEIRAELERYLDNQQ